MNFKLQNNISSLLNVKKYANSKVQKTNYKYASDTPSPSENIYNNVESQYLEIDDLTNQIKELVKKANEDLFPSYNYVNFDNDSLENMYNMSHSAEQSTNKPAID